MLFCQTKVCCDNLLKSLNADSLDFSFMPKVRYVCAFVGIKYYHDNILKHVSIDSIANLGDISLFATYLNKTVLDLNNNPKILYDYFSHNSIKADVAIKLGHLDGLKYLFDNITELYQTNFHTTRDRIRYAIRADDGYSLQSFLSYTKLPSSMLDLNLRLAYQHGCLESAYVLIKAGAIFNIKYLLDISPYLNSEKHYINHLDHLLLEHLINNTTFNGAVAVIKAIFHNHLISTPCINATVMTLIHSREVVCNKIVNISVNVVTKSLFAFVSAVRFPHIIIPSIAVMLPFYMSSSQYFKIYNTELGDKRFLPKFIHELTHAFLDVVFQNKAKPYFANSIGDENEMYKNYKRAKSEFLQNLVNDLRARNLSKVLEVSENALANNAYLHLNEYCLHTTRRPNLLTIMLANISSSELRGFLGDINALDVLIDILGGNIKLTKLIDFEKHSRSKDNAEIEFIKMIAVHFATDIAGSEQIVVKYADVKNGLKKQLNDFCTEQKINPEYSEFLSRIFDYLKRESEDYDSELLPRFVEVYLDKDSSQDIKAIYKPLHQYWIDNVVPVANQIISASYSETDNPFAVSESSFWDRWTSILPFKIDETTKNVGDVLQCQCE